MNTKRALVTALAAGCLLVACSGDDPAADADLRVAVTQLPASVEQLHLDPDAGQVLFHNVYETLFEYDDIQERLLPMVATRYAYLDDNTALELTIRDDVRFHDGTALTTQVLAEQFDRMQQELGDALPITGVEVVDEARVRLHTEEPDTGLVGMLAGAQTALWLPSPEADGAPLGTGPYQVSAFEPGTALEVRSVEDERFPAVRHAVVVAEVVDGPMEQIMAVAEGEAELATRIGSAWAETVTATDGARFYDPDGPQDEPAADTAAEEDGLLDLDECGTRLFPPTSPSPLLTNTIFMSMETVTYYDLVGPDDFAAYAPWEGIDCNRFHAESGLEFLVISEDLEWDAAAVWRVDLRQQ